MYVYIYIYIYIHAHVYVCLYRGGTSEGEVGGEGDNIILYNFKDGQTYPKRFLLEPFEAY